MNPFTLTGPAGIVVDAVLKGTLFLTLLFVASPLLRKLSAGSRHLVWGTALVLLVAIPLISRVLPWHIGVLPAVASAKVEAPRAAPSPAEHPAPSVGVVQKDEPAVGVSAPATPTTAITPPWYSSVDLGKALVAIWAGGFVLVLFRLWFARRSAQQLLAGARALSGKEWDRAAIRAADHLSLDDLPSLRVSPELPLPITLGVRHPAILLPEESEQWPEDRRSSVLLHEMAHIRRRDVVTHLAARLATAAWWFHPLAWRALTRFRLESERAADDLVLAAGRRASEYAQDLLAVVQDAGRVGAPIHALAMSQRADFEGRLLAILEPGASRRGVTPMTAIPLVLLVSLAAFPLAAIGPRGAALPEASAPPVAILPTVNTPPRHETPAAAVASVSTATRVETSTRVATRSAAIESMGQTHGAVVALVELLHDSDVGVRREAVQSLGQLGDTTVVAALTQALASDADEGVRRAAAWALGQLEQASAVPALTAALKRDRDIEVRRNCAWALGQIEDASAVDALGGVLNDPDAELRQKAVWALGQIESARSVPFLIPVLKDADPETRSQAVWALGHIESKDATEALVNAVGDSSREVRSKIAWALGQIEDARGVPGLSRLLRDPVADVRKQAAWALGQI